VSQTKYCCSLEVKRVGPSQRFGLATLLPGKFQAHLICFQPVVINLAWFFAGISEQQRWPESLFQTPARLLFQNVLILIRKYFKVENPTPVRTPATADPTGNVAMFLRNKWRRRPLASAEIEKRLRIRVRKQKRRIHSGSMAISAKQCLDTPASLGSDA